MAVMLECAYAVAADVTGTGGGGEEVAARVRDLDDLSGAQVAFQLHCSESYAAGQIFLAQDLIDRLPTIYTALSEGRICQARAAVFSDVLADLPDEDAQRLTDRYIGKAEQWTPPQLRRNLTSHVDRLYPERIRRR